MPSPLPVKADIHADKTLSPKAAPSATDLIANGNGMRSGAQAPEPKSSAEIPSWPQARTPVKAVTPNLEWPTPKPGSARVKSASPKLDSPKLLPPITSPKPGSPAGQAPKSPAQEELKWPSPRAEEPQPV